MKNPQFKGLFQDQLKPLPMPTEAAMVRLMNRPMPFKASYHGSSTIIVDGDGRWAIGQVPQEQADQIAEAMNAWVKDKKIAQAVEDYAKRRDLTDVVRVK